MVPVSQLSRIAGARLAFALLACTLWLSGCGGDKPADGTSRYVALGDSNTSGAGLPTPATGAPKNCFRTDSGYPSLAARHLSATEFASVACSGAGIGSFVTVQDLYPDGSAPPQFNALRGNETIVSLTIGDNDAGFGEVTKTCLNAESRRDTPCRDRYVTSGKNQLVSAAHALAKPLGESLDAIRERSPRAQIYVIGYGPIIPRDGVDCWGKVDVSEPDAPVFYAWQAAITDTERSVARSHGARYVDFFNAGKGHDACKPSKQRWTNPVHGVGDAGWPLHPTLAGSAAVAKMFVAAVRTDTSE